MARIAVAGGTGLFSRFLLTSLVARGNQAVAIGAPAADAREWKKDFGVENRPLDQSAASPREWADALHGCDAVVLCCRDATGDGADGGWPALTEHGCDTVLEAMATAGVRRCVLLRTLRGDADLPEGVHGLDCTVLRTGRLLEDVLGTNRIALGSRLPVGDVSASDAATAVVAVLETPGTAGRAWDLTSGDTAPRRAVRAALASEPDPG